MAADRLDELEKLHSLKEKGALTEQEFEQEKGRASFKHFFIGPIDRVTIAGSAGVDSGWRTGVPSLFTLGDGGPIILYSRCLHTLLA